MGLEYVIFYTEASIVCIVILLMILINDRFYNAQQEKQIWFCRSIVCFILYFISDIGWAAVVGGQIPRTRALVEFFNLTNYVLISLAAYEWFIFMAVSEKMTFRNFKRTRRMLLLPMVISVLIMVGAYAFNPYFWISETEELNILYYPLMLAAPAFYIFAAFVLSIFNATKTQSRKEKRLYCLIGMIPLGVMGFGLLQVFSLSAPTFCFGCTLMLLFFYIQNMQMLISVDDLTRLNNRGQINRFMDQMQFRENAKVFIMMIDIDRFKQINDTFGHAEGDRALMLVSEVLKRTCEQFKAPVFLGRYGGDEFTVIIQNPEEDEYPERTAERIREALAEKCREIRLSYVLEVSIGYDGLRDRYDTMKDCMIRADEKLYQEKRTKSKSG